MTELTRLDQVRDELMERLPGWQVWYVLNHMREVTWCARPLPQISASSPQQLISEIAQVHLDAGADWQALAGFGDYAGHAPLIKQPGDF